MIFHIDVFHKQQGNDREVVYMTAIMQIDEELSETLLGLVDAVLGEFRNENPYITNMYIKSENAGSYHRNFAIFKVSMKSVNPKVQSSCIMISRALFTSLPSTILLSCCRLIITNGNYFY